MKITCDHCRSTIDIEKDKKCPNCGASYSNNAEYKRIKEADFKRTEYEFREREANLETRQITNDMLRNSAKIGKRMFFAPLIIFVAVIAFMGFMIYKGNKMMNKDDKDVDQAITVNYNEVASTSKYDFKVDGIKTTETSQIMNFLQDNDENYTYYDFHVIFKNKTDSWNNLSDINCTYTDENGNEDIKAQRTTGTELFGFTTEIVTYSGYITCKIPNYAKDVNVKFEKTTIQIKDFREYIK